MASLAEQQAKWCVIHTYSGYENKVMSDIEKIITNRPDMQDRIFEIKIPTETVTEISDGKEKEYVRKVFPGYVFLKMFFFPKDSDEYNKTWFTIRNIHGVTGFVGPGGSPVALTDKEVANIGLEGVAPAQQHTVELSFSVGDTVCIISGPLEGINGTVESLDNDERTAKILVSMFGQETSVEVDFDQLKVND